MKDKLQVTDCHGTVHNIDIMNVQDFSSHNGVTRVILKQKLADGRPLDIMTDENEDNIRKRYSKLYDAMED